MLEPEPLLCITANSAADVRVGSKAAQSGRPPWVRFTSMSGHQSRSPAGPFRANSGLMHRSKHAAVLRLIRSPDRRRVGTIRRSEAECLGGLEIHHQLEFRRL